MDEQLRLRQIGHQLVEWARPFLEKQDGVGLAAAAPRCWPTEMLLRMLDCDEPDTLKVAATCLGLVAGMEVCVPLARLLHHEDPIVVATIEDALWCIWFRAGGPAANCRLQEASRRIDAGSCSEAIATLTELIRDCPDFAEAYNQRAIAYYLNEQFTLSMDDCRRTLELNPVHFGAAAGLGHCHAHLGQYREALECYYAALGIHPRLQGIRRSIRQVRKALDGQTNGLH